MLMLFYHLSEKLHSNVNVRQTDRRGTPHSHLLVSTSLCNPHLLVSIPFCNPSPLKVSRSCDLLLIEYGREVTGCHPSDKVTSHKSMSWPTEARPPLRLDEVNDHVGKVLMAENCRWPLGTAGRLFT